GLGHAVAIDVGAVGAPEVDQDPAGVDLPQLGMTGAGIDVALRIERDLALGVAAEPHARRGREFLALATAAAGNVVDDDPHGGDGITGRRATTQGCTPPRRSRRTATTRGGSHAGVAAPGPRRPGQAAGPVAAGCRS